MTKTDLYKYINSQQLAVISTSADHSPQAALIGIAVTPNLEIIFDTVASSRKYKALLANPKAALVIGWENETTIQYEGEAVLLGDDAVSDQYRELYFAAYSDGRERANTWPGLVHFKVSPKWIRYSNFNEPLETEEFLFEL